MKKTRLVCISDTHGYHRKITIPKCDILVVAGDLTSRGEMEKLKSFNKWVGELKDVGTIKEAVVIPGNHDLTLDTEKKYYVDAVRQSGFSNCHFYIHEACEVLGWKFFCSAYTPEFCGWAFSYERGNEAALKWLAMEECDIVVTHGPPHGVLDYAFYSGENVGCKDLLNRIYEIQPLLHIFGHIHEGFGDRQIEGLDTTFINASTCTLQYQPTNKPVVLDIWRDETGKRYSEFIF